MESLQGRLAKSKEALEAQKESAEVEKAELEASAILSPSP